MHITRRNKEAAKKREYTSTLNLNPAWQTHWCCLKTAEHDLDRALAKSKISRNNSVLCSEKVRRGVNRNIPALPRELE